MGNDFPPVLPHKPTEALNNIPKGPVDQPPYAYLTSKKSSQGSSIASKAAPRKHAASQQRDFEPSIPHEGSREYEQFRV